MAAAPVSVSGPTALEPAYRAGIRILLIASCLLLAFWTSLVGIYRQTGEGTVLGYVFAIPPLVVIAAQGIARRPSRNLPIHDRQADVIVGGMVLGLAVLTKMLLVPRYFRQFDLLRLDLLALVAFVLGASIMLFGLRPVARYLPVWVLLLALFPLPYQLIVITAGGTPLAAGALMLPLGALATATAVGRTRQRAAAGAALTVIAGAVILATLPLAWRSAPLIAYQLVPVLGAVTVVNFGMFRWRRRNLPRRRITWPLSPLSAGNVVAGAALVVVTAVLLALIDLPAPEPGRITDIGTTAITIPPEVPAGWVGSEPERHEWVARFFGDGAVMYRQRMQQVTGEHTFDVFARPRTVMVDSVTTDRPALFRMYQGNLFYNISAMRVSNVELVELGYGVTGQLYSVVDDRSLLTWTALQFSWHNEELAQRLVLVAVDNHEPDAVFPEPANSFATNLNTLLTMFFRGNAAVVDTAPTYKDADLLSSLARSLISAQLGAVTEHR